MTDEITMDDKIKELEAANEALLSEIETLRNWIDDLEDDGQLYRARNKNIELKDALITIIKELKFDINNGKLVLEIAQEALVKTGNV
jgi:glutathionylspermidine synthase